MPEYILENNNKELLNEIRKYLMSNWICFKDIRKCNRPNIYITDFLEKFSVSISIKNIKNLNDFIEWLNKKNNIAYHKRFYGEIDLSEKNIQLCDRNRIWLGIYKKFSWIDEDL